MGEEMFRNDSTFVLEAKLLGVVSEEACDACPIDPSITQKWHISFSNRQIHVDPMKAVCFVTGVKFDAEDAHLTISTLGDSYEVRSSQDASWGEIRRQFQSQRMCS